VWGVWGCGGPAHSLRSTFHRLHLLRLWTPTIFITSIEAMQFFYVAMEENTLFMENKQSLTI
jgi:hypothetical protein